MRPAKWFFIALICAQAHPSAAQTPPQDLPTIEALRALPAPATPRATMKIRQHGEKSRFGGGTFAWSPNDRDADDDGITIAPSGYAAPGRWVRQLEEPGVISPLFYGAACDSRHDDTDAISRAIAFARRPVGHGDMSTKMAIIRLPAGECLIKGTINATAIVSVAVMIEGSGGALFCEAAGKPCLDAMESNKLGLRDVTIYGDPKSPPSIGLQLGRVKLRDSAAGMYLDHVSISGAFSFTAFYNLAAETQLDVKLNASNIMDGGYGAVYDGYNHWHAHSDFINITLPFDLPQSFNDNSCINCRITTGGRGGIPVWAGYTSELTFHNSYISNFATGPAVVLYNFNINPNFDVHFEAGGLTHVFILTGRPHYSLYGLIYREHDFFASQSMFGLGPDVQSVSLENADISIGIIHGHGTWFDDPAKYTVSGHVAGLTANGWATPGGGFTGMACFATKCIIR